MSSLNVSAVMAVWKRQLGNLLGNPLGYVYIFFFVLFASWIQFWPDSYFARNICDLGPQLEWMPWFLVVLLPALAMGSWALERELGTEEQLLTLPMGVFDALLGKWLGVVSFFTIALFCFGYQIFTLFWLGNPDLGLVVANFTGWWLAGLVFSAASLLASTLVSMPAIAFVIGLLFCAGVMKLALWLNWFDPFNRGLVPLSGLVSAVVMVALLLALSALVLSARRWQKALQGAIICQAVILVASAITLINFSVQASRKAVDIDVSSEGLSSLSPASIELLRKIESPVKIDAFISKDLPSEMKVKSKEVMNFLKSLDRQMGSKVNLEIRQPSDPLDEAGIMASQHFGLRTRRVSVDTVTGKELREVFMGCVISTGGREQKIDYFDSGLSVEYELVRTIQTVSGTKKPVLGIVSTDMKVLGDFNFQARSQQPEWQIVQEWRKQYEVREVNLDVKVADDVDVLVAMQPSSLDEKGIKRLHDYIWEGRPCMILEDPLPIFSDPELGTSRPKKQKRPMMMGMPPPQAGGKKGDMQPIMRALGLLVDTAQGEIGWSDFVPSHEFRGQMPVFFVWTFKSKGGIQESTETTGIESMMLPFPGLIRESPTKPGDITVTPLIKPIESVKWGKHTYDDHFGGGFFGPQKKDPPLYPGHGKMPYLAVAIKGKMKRAYPFSEDADGDKKDPKKKPDEDPDRGKGRLGDKEINVVFVADTDMAHDGFFQFYRNENNQFSADNLDFLRQLRNVQFLANVVDSLAGNKTLLELRTRKPQRRPLEVLEDVLEDTQAAYREKASGAKKDAEAKIKALRADFDKRLAKIDERKGMDESSKRQLKKQVELSAQRKLDADIAKINLETEEALKTDRVVQKREIKKIRSWVRWRAIVFPSAFLVILAGVVFFQRVVGERATVPASRKRS